MRITIDIYAFSGQSFFKFNEIAIFTKKNLLNNNLLGYIMLSMLAGMFVGFGVLLVFTLSGALDGAPYTKLVMGIAFSVALSLVIIAGAELFTGRKKLISVE